MRTAKLKDTKSESDPISNGLTKVDSERYESPSG